MIKVIDLNLVGEHYHKLGMCMEAKQAFESALDIVQQKYPQHPQVNHPSHLLLLPMQTKVTARNH